MPASKSKEMIGKKFGKLTVLKCVPANDKSGLRYLCKCDCGNETTVRGYPLRSGEQVSCKCDRQARGKIMNKSHGYWNSRTYSSYRAMLSRCYNPNEPGYENYGGAGITVCEKWQTFEGFLEDMGERPANTSIDRIDGTKGYFKENCRWASPKVQGQNTTNVRWLDVNGEKICMSDLAKRLNIDGKTLHYRLKVGWPMEKILNTPGRKSKGLNNVRR